MRILGVTLNGAFSGADRAFFEGLRSRGHLIDIVSGELPVLWKTVCLARSFRLPKRRWYDAWQRRMVKSPDAFVRRTRELDRQLCKRRGEFDLILQVGGLFAPFNGEFPKPVVLFCDYTTKLAERNYQPWFGLNTAEAVRWYELETGLYRRCRIICTASENTRRSVIADYGVDQDRVRVIGEGVSEVHHHPDKTYREKTVLMVGIDFERKGGDTLINAFRDVRRVIPDARLYLVGPNQGTVSDGVFWLGHINDRKRLHQIFAEATVFAMPSICEPFGLAILEAMSHGLPVIGSTVDAMPELIEDGTTGYLIKPGDSEALADRLVQLLSNPDACIRMGQAGRTRVGQQFLWQHAVDRIEHALARDDNFAGAQ